MHTYWRFTFYKGELLMFKLLIMTLTLFSLGCNSSDKPKNIKQKTPTNVTQAELQSASKLLISGFMTDLKSELQHAIKEGGVASAISACQTKAPQVTDSFSNEKWSIKRVTEKPRNHLNNADAHEQEILGFFADTLKKLEFFDEWTDPENKTGYTYYQPSNMGKFCLMCHGDSKAIDEKVSLALQDKYPEDKAINYTVGDLRGMFVVHIKNGEDILLLQQALHDSL
jgi:uncharacterized protein DUF3365